MTFKNAFIQKCSKFFSAKGLISLFYPFRILPGIYFRLTGIPWGLDDIPGVESGNPRHPPESPIGGACHLRALRDDQIYAIISLKINKRKYV